MTPREAHVPLRRPAVALAAVASAFVLAVASAFVLALTADPAASQTITVTVLNAETSRPVTGAVVQLYDEAGALLGRQLSDARGRVLFFRSGVGQQRLRAEMIGMATAETELFQVDHGATLRRELRLEPNPIPIQGLSVEGDERCRTDPSEGIVTARLWDEARKALTAAAIADEQSLYRYHILLYEQDLDRDRRVVERSRQARREAAVRTPFVSRPVDHLMEHGFVERSGGIDLYLAPDANVLLSGPFLDSHCFGVRAGRGGDESEGLVGLTFEPTSDRRHLVEVAGTLWLDPGTSELRWLQFRYVNLDPEIRLDEVGGRVDFSRMPDGGWIIPEWHILMPNVALQRNLAGDGFRTYVRGFRETGGRVLEIQEPGRVIGHSMAGAMEGVVEDSTGTPLEDVRVELAGTEWVDRTDSTGTFTFYPLVEGVYEIRLIHPTLERFGRPPVELTRLVVDGETTLLETRLPSLASVVLEECGGPTAMPPDSLPLVMSVRAADGRGAGDAAVRLTWSEGPTGFEGFSLDPDDAGTYALCRVPRDRDLRITATLPGQMGEASVEAAPTDEILSVEIRLQRVDARGRTVDTRMRTEDRDAAPIGPPAVRDGRDAGAGRVTAERAWLDSIGVDIRRSQALFQRTGPEIVAMAYDSVPELLAEVPRLEVRRRRSGETELRLHPTADVSPGSDDSCVVDVYLNGRLVRQRIADVWELGIHRLVDPGVLTAIEVFDGEHAPVGPSDACGVVLLWVDELRDGDEPGFVGSVRGRIRGLGDAAGEPRVRLAPGQRVADVDAEGRFELGDVPPARYTVQVDLPGVGAWSMPMEVRAGSVAEISIEVNR